MSFPVFNTLPLKLICDACDALESRKLSRSLMTLHYRGHQPPEIMSVYNGHLMTLCSVPAPSSHCSILHNTPQRCRQQVSILHGIGNILLQNSNWIIAAWASGDCLVGCCWFQYFQYHGTEYCAMFCEPGAAAADITSAAWSLRSM